MNHFIQKRVYFHNSMVVMIVLLAVGLRFALMSMHWPVSNADEAIMGLMARHIAYQGEHPVFYWGQEHMGTIQAFLGACFFRWWGSSIFNLRLGTLFLFTLYLLGLYFLVRLLFSPGYALFITALLSIGADRAMSVPMLANGGYAETMLFAVLIFLLTAYLALSAPRPPQPVRSKRLLTYAGLGLVTGLALWSDQLVLSAILTAGVALLVCCRHELRGWAGSALLVGLLAGAAPLIDYNIFAPPAQNSLLVLLGTTFSGLPRTIPIWQEWLQTLLIALPLTTSMPFSSGVPMTCDNVEPYARPIHSLAEFFPGSSPWLCVSTHALWSLAILLLWGLAVVSIVLTLRREGKRSVSTVTDQQTPWRARTLLYARLMLLGSGALWLLLFAFSAGGQWTPRGSSRYLIGLLLAIPAVLWPLWQSLQHVKKRAELGQRLVRTRATLSVILLSALVVSYLASFAGTVATLPDDQAAYQHINTLVNTLLSHGITRFYSDYDTCPPLIFQSNERLVCSVLDEQLQPGMNRYDAYVTQVAIAAHPAYLFPLNSPQDRLLAQRLEGYQHLVIEGESLYYQSS